MKVSKTNVCHIRYSDSDEYLIDTMAKFIDKTRDTMRAYGCDVMFNSYTGEVITLDEFDRLAGILGGLADMDEIFAE